MGLKSFLGNTIKASSKTFKKAAGQSLWLKSMFYSGYQVNSEIYQQNGVFSSVPPGVAHVTVPINGDPGHLVSIAFHNYRLNISISDGATLVYSTDSSGDSVKGRILIDSDGKIGVASDAENLKSSIDALLNALLALRTTPDPLLPPTSILDATTIAAISGVAAKFDLVLKDI